MPESGAQRLAGAFRLICLLSLGLPLLKDTSTRDPCRGASLTRGFNASGNCAANAGSWFRAASISACSSKMLFSSFTCNYYKGRVRID